LTLAGFTIDVLKLRSGHPDLAVVRELREGCHYPLQRYRKLCNALYARILEDCDIDEVIRNQTHVLPGEVQQLIRTMTSDFLTEFYNFLRERGR
jgi:plasmid segregation protein ParM